jgi:SAM-dependent methyltransferase
MSASYDSIILKHYRDEAQQHGDAATSTMSDLRTRKLETDFLLGFIARYVPADGSIADFGCGNGFTLAQIRAAFPKLRLTGFEFTPDLCKIATERFAGDPKTEIVAGDIRQPARDASFDAVVCQRVLINLLDPQDQAAGLRNLAAALVPGGYLALIEAFNAPLNNLNAARAEFGLPPLPPAHHNLYLADTFFEVEKSLEPARDPALPENFLSTHYFVSRVLHPLALEDRPFVRNSHFVKFLSSALQPAVGDYSPVRGRIFRKNGPQK